MCGPAAIPILAAASAVVSAGGQVYSGLAARNQGQYEAKVANINAGVQLRARDDAAARGEIEQMQHWRKVSQQYGTQRAAQAASGLDVGFGSPADLLSNVNQIGGEDASTIAQNTAREMRGYEVNAANYRMQGAAARSKGNAAMVGASIGAFSSILGAASQFGKMSAAGG